MENVVEVLIPVSQLRGGVLPPYLTAHVGMQGHEMEVEEAADGGERIPKTQVVLDHIILGLGQVEVNCLRIILWHL